MQIKTSAPSRAWELPLRAKENVGKAVVSPAARSTHKQTAQQEMPTKSDHSSTVSAIQAALRWCTSGYASLLFLLSFVVIAAGYAIYQLQLRNTQLDAERAVDTAISALTQSASASDPAALKGLSERILEHPDTKRVVVVRADGSVRLDAGANPSHAAMTLPFAWMPDKISSFSISRALSDAPRANGHVTVDFTVPLLATTFFWILVIGTALIIASLILALREHRKFNNAVTIPANAIEHVSNEITRTGNLSHRMPSLGSTDAGGIEATVNKMLTQLDEQEKKRALYRAHLEREVKKRTTALAASNHRLNKLAYMSTEAGLPNRAAFLNRLHQLCSSSGTDGAAIGLFVVRIASVRYANETFGFDVGDMIIESVARTMALLRTDTTEVFHLGGGEFALLRQDLPDAMPDVATEILRIDDVAFVHKGATLHLRPKVGYAIYPVDASNVDELTRFAMLALNAVTGSESAQSAVRYVPALLAETISITQLETAIKHAIDTGQFEPHFQSRVNTQTGQVHGLEALVRWTSPALEGCSNYQLIPIAERSLLITELDSQMLRKVTEWLGMLALEGVHISVAVNLSARTLQRASLPDEIAALVSLHNLHMEQIELELTETVLIDQSAVVSQNLALFRNMGVGLLLDDFGSGYSSLRYLYELPISTVKIDALFVRGLPGDPASLAIVESTINLAHRLGKRVVAEGVETFAQWELLASMGCDEVQGYFLMRPQPAGVVADMLRQQFDTSVGRLTIDLTSLAPAEDFPWSQMEAVPA